MNNNKKLISVSILSANLAKLGEELDTVLKAGADWIHFDVMDNHFVPNLTFGPILCQSLRNYGIIAPIDVHLMTQSVDQLIIDFAKAGANIITIHPESTNHLHRSLQLIKDHGCQAGLALSPATPIDVINYVYKQLDLILIMSVNPGFAGQKFINNSFKKIELIKDLLSNLAKNYNNKHNILLSIDGGVNLENIAKLSKIGINVFVAGSSIFGVNDTKVGCKDIVANIKSLHSFL